MIRLMSALDGSSAQIAVTHRQLYDRVISVPFLPLLVRPVREESANTPSFANVAADGSEHPKRAFLSAPIRKECAGRSSRL